MATNAPVDAFKAAMSKVAAAVTIITVGRGEHRRGLTVTAMCSVSMDPPTLLVCVNRSAEAHEHIKNERTFCVNVLGSEDSPLADRFASRDGSKGVVRFEGRHWDAFGDGQPALAEALVSVECDLADLYETASHTIFIGTVTRVRTRPEAGALVYYDRSYRRLD